MANTTKTVTVKINLDTLSAEDSAKVLKVHIQQLKDNVEKAAVGTKKHDAALERLNATLKKTGASTKRVTQETNAEAQAHKNSSIAIQREIAEQKRIQSTLDVTSTKYKETTLRIAGLNAKMNQSSNATGLASSSALEFGRVISDAPYGIRGVANNVSQLVSQMSYAAIAIDATTGKAIGFTGAIRNMWTAMLGPLGILLAFQAVIAAVDYFYGSTKKAEKATDKLSETFSKLESEIAVTIAELETYADVYKNATEGSNEHTAALKELKELGFDPATDALDAFIEKQKELVVVEATLDVYGDKLKSLSESKAIADELIAEANNKVVETVRKRIAIEEELKGRVNEADLVRKKTASLINDEAEGMERVTKLTKQRGDILLNINDAANDYKETLRELLKLTNNKKSGGKNRRLADFEARNLDMWNEALSFSKKQSQLQDKTDEERLASTQKYEALALQIKKDAFIEAEAIKLRKYISKNPDKKDEATAEFDRAALVAEEQLQMALSSLGVLHSEQRFSQQRDALISFNETMLEEKLSSAQAHSDALKDRDEQIGGYGSLELMHEQQREVWALEDAQFEEDQIRLGEKLYEEYGNWEQVKDVLAEKKSQYDIERMQDEIDLEQQKIDRKKEINAEYISWVQGLSSVFKSIGKDNEVLAATALVLEKGSAIAGIVIQTQAANAKILASSTTAASAYGQAAASSAAMVGGGPQGFLAAAPYIKAGIAESTASKGRILKNNIGAGISIAAIAATSLTGGGSPSGGGGSGDSGGGSTFTPSFNVVGNSGENQLAQSISGQVNSPTRAFVVYDDITEAGDLQNNAISTSGLG
jgi:hypothetical protein